VKSAARVDSGAAVTYREHPLDVVELVPSRLYVLGGRLLLDETISWAPKQAWGRLQPMNALLLREDDEALIVDPGLAWFEDLVAEQVQSVLPPGSRVAVYVTRPELDTFGSLPKIADLYEIANLYAGGNNPFDAFDQLTSVAPSRRSERIALFRFAHGADIPINGDRAITVLRPSLRVLITHWGYDARTKTLFTSDAFGHGTTADGSESRIMTDDGGCDIETVRSHLFAKFWWLQHAGANIRMVASDLAAIFETYPITTIAPSRGRVIVGRDAVREHHELVQQVFNEIAQNAPEAPPAERVGGSR
jgi:flavorubredoxin